MKDVERSVQVLRGNEPSGGVVLSGVAWDLIPA